MGELIIIFLFLAGALTIVIARIVQLREQQEARTREWIEFLQDDLSSAL